MCCRRAGKQVGIKLGSYAAGANLLLSVKQGLLLGIPYRRVGSGLVHSVRDHVGACFTRQPGSPEVLKGTVEKVH